MKPFLVRKAIKRHKKRQAKRWVQYWHSPPYYTESIDIIAGFRPGFWDDIDYTALTKGLSWFYGSTESD